ncbi:PA14 domain-containing protein [Candidatus Nitrotoga sp. HW29]|uniref:putative baseplate assembly protein n=1 Tax=Candidatus Nitrotoga sp. HW29 TaxID=2886963 RepID=UPI001EF18627|nr:putative baseplate assembly protein [Candidatus Nitrotoga sp. HW29]CAH1905578.1 PA14 domain-containing protein [Candidatus Nitrotoga sp. HW29]
MSGEEQSSQDACGCCAGVGIQAPALLYNRPGLAAIAYRIGTHSEVLASMQARLSSQEYPALSKLRTRDSDDFSIALLDAYACMADVLSFYQERLANESYLRTSSERLSLSELARLIGYRLKPGVAAETYLAFTLQEPPPQPVSSDPKQATGVPDKVNLDIGIKVQSIPGPDEKPQTFETVERIEARPAWNVLLPKMHEMKLPVFGTKVVYLQGTATQLKAGDALLFVGTERENNTGNENWDFRRIQRVVLDSTADRTIVTLDHGLGTALPYVAPAADPKVYVLRQRASLFGYNAPDWRAMSAAVKQGYLNRAHTATDIQWPGFKITDISGGPVDSAHTLHLDALYPQVVRNSWLVLSVPEYQELYQVKTAGEDARANFTLTSKVTRLTVKGENLNEIFNERLRETAVFAHSEKLTLAETPITADVSGDFLRVDRKVEELAPGRKMILSGTTIAGDEVSEVLTLLSTEADGNTSKLFFTASLQHQYRRDTVKLYANVALATHGETVNQILGSGAARLSHQRYTLKHTPLTFVGAENETGAEAALEVRVNDIRWHETPTFYQAGANDRSYVLRVEEDGAGTIQFGDGRHGARLPTGQDNLRAVYRKGIGTAGNLQAGQLSQLLSRPLGLKVVSNPLPAAGGVNADSAAHARRNMPLGVRTLGRVVSVQDYEDYALAFTGIAKTQATVLNTRAGRTVFITVAGDNGVQPPDLTLTKLLNTLKQNGDPLVHCETKAYNEATFHLALRIKCDPDHEGKKVLVDVETALRVAFSFDARDFGQVVSRSEIIAIAQTVQGVLGVDLDRFYRGTTITLEQRLTPTAAVVDAQRNGIAAEILLLDTGPFDYLEEMP